MIRIFIGTLALLLAAAGVVAGTNWWRYFSVHGESEAVSFASADGVVLEGTLFRPRSAGPHPAVVILHGSGPASGNPPFVSAHANAFIAEGFAVLNYDKRGSGASGGDFDTATYGDFINDAIAGVAMLRGRADIGEIGLFGSSESGWFTPEIAERAGGVAFIVNRAGPPLAWIETNLWEIRNELIAAGLTDEGEIAEFLRLREAIWRYYGAAAAARDPLPETRRPLEDAVSRVDQRWLDATGMRVAPYDPALYDLYVADIFYDPTPYWRRLDIPVLAVFAGADQNVPTERAVGVLEAMRRDDGVDVTLTVYPGYTHGMFAWRNLFSMGYPPSYLPGVAQWAREQID